MARMVISAVNNTPGAGEVIATLGPFGAPIEKQFVLVLAGTALATLIVRQRNADNDADVWSFECQVGAGQTVVIPDLGYRLPYDSGNDAEDYAERIQVVNKTLLIAGSVSAAFLVS